MRKFRYEFLLIAGLIMTLGCATVFANDRDRVKRPKNSGILTVKTDEAYTVKINGERAGMSGVNSPAVFYLTPDEYDIEIEGKDGKILWVERGVSIVKNRKHCICLKTVTRTDKEPCPYDVHLEGPSRFRKDVGNNHHSCQHDERQPGTDAMIGRSQPAVLSAAKEPQGSRSIRPVRPLSMLISMSMTVSTAVPAGRYTGDGNYS